MAAKKFTTEIKVKSGDVFTINALTDVLTRKVATALREKNMKMEGFDADVEKNIEFKLALANACLVKVNLLLPSGEYSEMPAKEHAEWIGETPGAADFLITQARKFAKETAAYFEDEEKNS
jgi:hypothetical protein